MKSIKEIFELDSKALDQNFITANHDGRALTKTDEQKT